MSDTTLWCVVEGEKTPFSIIASSTMFIAELQIMIKKEKANVFQRVDAPHITLSKVDVDFDAVEDKISCGEYRPKANDQSQSLRTVKAITSRISEVWPEQPPCGHLHVFITLPDKVDNLTIPTPDDPLDDQQQQYLLYLYRMGPQTMSIEESLNLCRHLSYN